jgi:hypothetical protein
MTATKQFKTFMVSLIFGIALVLALLLLSGTQAARAAHPTQPASVASVAQQDIALADSHMMTIYLSHEPMYPMVGEDVTFTISRENTRAPLTVEMDFGDSYFGGEPVMVKIPAGEDMVEKTYVYNYPFSYDAMATPISGTMRYESSASKDTVKVRPKLSLTFEPMEPKVDEPVTACLKIEPAYQEQDLQSDAYKNDEYQVDFGDGSSMLHGKGVEAVMNMDTVCFTHSYATSDTYMVKGHYTMGVYGENAAEVEKEVIVTKKVEEGAIELPEEEDEVELEEGDKITGIGTLRDQGVAYIKVTKKEAVGDLPGNPGGSGLTEETFFGGIVITFYDAEGNEMTGLDLTGALYTMNISADMKPNIFRATLVAMYYDGTNWIVIWNTIFMKLAALGLAEAQAGTLTFPFQGEGDYAIRGSSTGIPLYLPVITK